MSPLFSFNMGKSIGKLPDPAGGKAFITGSYDYTVPEGDRLPFFQPVAKNLFAITEYFLSQGVSRKKTITPRMPVSGVTWITRMINKGNTQGIIFFFSI